MTARHALEDLARLYRVQASYHDGLGQYRECSEASLLAILRSVGAPIERLEEAEEALRGARLGQWRRALEPVTVAWGAGAPTVRLRVPRERWGGRYAASLILPDGEPVERRGRLEELPVDGSMELGGDAFRELRLELPRALPRGRHRLEVEIDETLHGGWILAAPERAWLPEGRCWGVFLPLYALWSGRSTGAGDLTDLRALVDLVGELGGGLVGTLPLCAAFLGEVPHDPSPYAPVSRQFWNELYLDPEQVPELARCPRAREMLASEGFRREAQALQALPMVDYRRQMALRRGVLEELAHCFFAGNDGTELAGFVADRPRVLDYARFRAATETRGEVWHCWPDRMRAGLLEPGDWDEAAFRYHLWVQWRTAQQLEAVADAARAQGPGIYLDVPLGVHPDGYDAWRERDAFLTGCAAGAPPDMLFTAGQNWGFWPLSPDGMRGDGYRYLTDSLRHQMRLSGVLRIDHVMGLHRIYCVPHGADARDGAYVHYHPEELYAVLTTESVEHRTTIVGEDLGTVPPEVREAMERHALQRMYVFPFELRPGQEPFLVEPREDSVASLDTHDMPSFDAFFHGRDVDDRVQLGLLSDEAAEGERRARRETMEALARHLGVPCEAGPVLRAAVARLAEGPARLLLINLEDLWLEPDPQNVPGTSTERPNWRRRARHGLEALRSMPEVVDLLRSVAARRGPQATPSG